MSRIGITFDEVTKAAETILIKGENPTIEKVRLALGSRGSNSTISKYLGEWRSSSLPKLSKEHNSQAISPPDPVNRAVNAVWEQIQAEKEAEIAEIKTRFETENKKLKVANSELESNLREILAKSEELDTINQELNTTLANTNQELQHEKQLLAVVKTKHDSLDASKQELKIELEKVHEKHLVEVRKSQQQALTILEKRYQRQVEELKSDLDNTKNKAEASRHQAIVELDILKTANHKLETNLEKAKEIKTELEAKILIVDDELQAAKTEFNADISKLKNTNSDLKAENTRFISLLETSNLGLNLLNEKLDKLLINREDTNIFHKLAKKIDNMHNAINLIKQDMCNITAQQKNKQSTTKVIG